MEAGITAGWSDFLVAVAGAAGALAGLVFVSLSINLSRIIALPYVAGRAAETIVVLGGVLIGALLALMPGQSAPQLGWELLSVTVAVWLLPTGQQIRVVRDRSATNVRRGFLGLRMVLHQLATAPGVIASLIFISGGHGLPWAAFGVVWSFTAALFNAWVLLVEIVR